MCYFNYENLNTMSKKKFIHKVLLPNKENYYYPLSNDNLSKEDLDAGIKILKSEPIKDEISALRLKIREKESMGEDPTEELNAITKLRLELNEL